jgi:spore germination protein GerM
VTRAALLVLLFCTLPAQAASVQVFFSPALAPQTPADCARVQPVRRDLPSTPAVATATLHLLFAGPSEDERAAGLRSPFSPATAGLLKRLVIRRGTAYVDLHDLRSQLGGATSSCGALELRTQIERTLRQFPTVQRVRLAVDGDPRALHEWLGESCDATNAHCDPRPFRPAPAAVPR